MSACVCACVCVAVYVYKYIYIHASTHEKIDTHARTSQTTAAAAAAAKTTTEATSRRRVVITQSNMIPAQATSISKQQNQRARTSATSPSTAE